jgi:hypothetical protein
MGSFNDLPVEIFCQIFDNLKRQIVGVRTPDEIQIVELAGKDVFECQRVCKQWMQPAQQIIYKEIYIQGTQQLMQFLDRMSRSSTKPSLMTETVLIDPENDIVFFATFFMAMSLFCPGIKTIHSVQVPSNYFWSVLMREQYEGHLEALEIVPPVNTKKLACVLHYELAAWSMYESLGNLHVFDWLPIPGKNITRLDCFKNLQTLKLSLEDFRNIYKLDKLIDSSRLESIIIDIELRKHPLLPDEDEPLNLSHVKALPNVKSLEAKNLVTNDNVISYFMRMLTGLDKLAIFFPTHEKMKESEVGGPRFKPLSTKVGIQFLEYLNPISDVYIDNVCVRDPLGIMAGYFEKLESLEVEYDIVGEDEEFDSNSYLKFVAYDCAITRKRSNQYWVPAVTINDKKRLKTVVTFEVKEETEALPHMEFLEDFGHELKSLSLDMGEDDADSRRNTEINSITNGQYFNHILQQCPQLQSLTLKHTCLDKCDFFFPEEKQEVVGNILEGGDLAFSVALIQTGVLEGLSEHIRTLRLLEFSSCCTYNGNIDEDYFDPDMVELFMPSTKISTLIWKSEEQVYCRPFLKFFLYLNIGGHIYCYTGGKSSFKECSQEEFDVSEAELESLSISIVTRSLDNLILNTFDYHMKISTTGSGYKIEETYPLEFARPVEPFDQRDNESESE